MQPQIERRSHAQRVPMDQGVVEVSFLEYGETAPADAVNIAEGGLSLRASILPDVGTELRCAFPMPDGQCIEADCEVVWAQHSGPYAGEFGLRFVDIARLDEERIRDYVEAQKARARGEWDDSAPGREDDSDGGFVDDSDPGHMARVSDGYDEHERALDAEAERYAAELEHSRHPAIPDTVTLYIDGVASPVAASVVHAAHEALIVEQELAFLREGIGIAAVEGGPKGRLSTVELRVVNGTPRLVLTVLFTNDAPEVPAESVRDRSPAAYAKTQLRSPLDTLPDPEEPAEPPRADEVIPATPRAAATLAAPTTPAAAEAPARVLRHVDARVSRPSVSAEPALDALDRDLASLDDELVDDELDAEFRAFDQVRAREVEVQRPAAAPKHAAPKLSPSLAAPQRAKAASMPAPRAAAGVADDAAGEVDDVPHGDTPVDRLSSTLRTYTRRLGERMKPVTERLREVSAGGLRGLLPALRLLFARLLAFVATLRAKAAPLARSLFAQVQGTLANLRSGEGGARVTKGGRPVRRQQSRMSGVPRTSQVPGSRFERAEALEQDSRLDPQRAKRRAVLLSTIAFILVGTVVWALTSGDDASGAAESASADSGVGATSEPLAAAQPASTGVVSPYVNATDEAVAPAPSGALAAAPVETAPSGPAPGPLAEPTYPSLGDARPQSPGTVPSDSPYAEGEASGEGASAAAPEVQEGRTFGADSVPNARSFEIAMSVPVRTLRGRVEGNGFVVDIPGALAMGGARTISRNHPMVARSHILNHGDHATLTVEFVEGQSPAYRVSARGAGLQIEIGR